MANLAGHDALPGAHKIDIATQSVDLAVVRQESERLGTIPVWLRVRREARVHERHVRLKLGICQVAVVLPDLMITVHIWYGIR